MERIEFNSCMLPLPTSGSIYEPLEAAIIITSLTGKGTSDRAKLIRLLIKNDLVKGKTTLYNVVRKYERGTPFVNKWNPHIGCPKKKKAHPLFKKDDIVRNVNPIPVAPARLRLINDQVRYHHGEWPPEKHKQKQGWKRSIILDVAPVRFSDDIDKLDLAETSRIDISQYLGQGNGYIPSDDEWRFCAYIDRIKRLHFSPRDFPPPASHNNDAEGGKNEVFSSLRKELYYCQRRKRKSKVNLQWGEANRQSLPVQEFVQRKCCMHVQFYCEFG